MGLVVGPWGWVMGEDSEDVGGWFDVQAYSSRGRWEGPELHDGGVDGFLKLEGAISCANSDEYKDCYEVLVVAYGIHAEHGAGEVVLSRRNRPAGMEYNGPSVAAADAALRAHRDHLGLEGDDEVQLWHLLASLKEWAAASGVDFAMQNAAVDAELVTGMLAMPAAEKASKTGRGGAGVMAG